MTAELEQLAYTRTQAAAAVGYSKDTIDAAVRSGDLRVVRPQINGRPVGRDVIRREDLQAWLDRVS